MLSRNCAGICGGPNNPPAVSMVSAGYPASAAVGSSGAPSARCLLVTNRTLIRPARINGWATASELLNAVLGKIVRRLHDVAIRYFRDLQAQRFDEAEDQKVGIAGGRGGVELAWMCARQRDQLAHGADIERRWHRDRQHRDVDLCDRHDIARIIGRLVLIIEVNKEGRSRAKEQCVIVVRAEKGIERNQAIAARAILDHDWLAPARAQSISKQSCRYVRRAGGTERQDEPNRAGRISLLRIGKARGL